MTPHETMHILALNAGSSSLKFALFRPGEGDLAASLRGAVDGIGTSHTRLNVRSDGGETCEPVNPVTNHPEAFQRVVAEVERFSQVSIDAVGHRVVHGGTRFRGPVRVDAAILDELRKLIPFAPLHQPVQLSLIEAARERFPSVPQVACFDTSVHHTLPEVASRFPLPKWIWDEGVRRYGFHGLSYEFVLESDSEFRQGKTIIAHLGNGASVTAFQDGVSVDTTMGFTPTGGLMMGSRCGDLDPGVLLYLLRQHGMTADDLDHLVNHESGLKGVSGTTSDVRSLLNSLDNAEARLAVDMFCYQTAKQIGGLAAVLNGVDRLIFTGGIGEHSARIRASVCDRLGFLGLSIDSVRNEANESVISRIGSRCPVHVVPTDEEQLIARQTLELLDQGDQHSASNASAPSRE